jgi:hypothetical protein
MIHHLVAYCALGAAGVFLIFSRSKTAGVFFIIAAATLMMAALGLPEDVSVFIATAVLFFGFVVAGVWVFAAAGSRKVEPNHSRDEAIRRVP